MEPEWTCVKSRGVSDEEAAAFLQAFLAESGQLVTCDSRVDGGGLTADAAVAESASKDNAIGIRRRYTPADTSRLLRALTKDVRSTSHG
jgi:hypothetical protein